MENKEAAKTEIANSTEENIVDMSGLDAKKILRAFEDIKKQNAYLFDTINRLDKADKHFNDKIRDALYIVDNLRKLTEKDLSSLQKFFVEIEEHAIDKKFLDKIATVNKPNSDSIKYGQSLMSLKKSFLNMAVKHASEKNKKTAAGLEDREQS